MMAVRISASERVAALASIGKVLKNKITAALTRPSVGFLETDQPQPPSSLFLWVV